MAEFQIALLKSQFEAVIERRRLNVVHLASKGFEVDDELFLNEVLLTALNLTSLTNLSEVVPNVNNGIRLTGRTAKARVTHVLEGLGLVDSELAADQNTIIGLGSNFVVLSISLLAVSTGVHDVQFALGLN